jgi:hypothetical protein
MKQAADSAPRAGSVSCWTRQAMAVKTLAHSSRRARAVNESREGTPLPMEKATNDEPF